LRSACVCWFSQPIQNNRHLDRSHRWPLCPSHRCLSSPLFRNRHFDYSGTVTIQEPSFHSGTVISSTDGLIVRRRCLSSHLFQEPSFRPKLLAFLRAAHWRNPLLYHNIPWPPFLPLLCRCLSFPVDHKRTGAHPSSRTCDAWITSAQPTCPRVCHSEQSEEPPHFLLSLLLLPDYRAL
jgi:hypothetical protein